MKKPEYHTIFAIFLLIIHFLIGIDTINHLSPTYDEHIHLIAGYSYLKTGKYYINIYDHPPAAEMYAALPLVFMKPILPTMHTYWADYDQYSIADIFMYRNRVDAEKMLNAARIMILLLSCLLGFIVFLWSKQLYGSSGGIAALILYVFSSNILAHGTLVTTDLPVALFYFLSIYVFWHWLNNQQIKTTILLALFTALTLTTKFSGIIILAVYPALLLIPPVRKKIKLSSKEFIRHKLLFLACTVVFVLIVYRFKSIALYFDGISRILTSVTKSGQPTFLIGRHSVKGWIYYFLVTFLLKTPVSLLLLVTLCLAVKRKKIIDPNTIILLLPAIIYFVIASFSKKQIGIRYIICIYPFIFVWVSGIVSHIKKNYSSKVSYFLIPVSFLLILWYATAAIKIHPWHISYCNEFIGSPDNGYKYFTDSNIDWGQGLKELGKWYRNENLKDIYLSYFGNAHPHYYGIKYISGWMTGSVSWKERITDNIIFSNSDREIFAISATNIQSTCFYPDTKAFDWIKQYKPDKIVAHSIFIYDLTKNRELLDDFRKFWSHR